MLVILCSSWGIVLNHLFLAWELVLSLGLHTLLKLKWISSWRAQIFYVLFLSKLFKPFRSAYVGESAFLKGILSKNFIVEVELVKVYISNFVSHRLPCLIFKIISSTIWVKSGDVTVAWQWSFVSFNQGLRFLNLGWQLIDLHVFFAYCVLHQLL